MPAEIQALHKMLEVPAKWTRQLAMQSSSSRRLGRACEKWSGFSWSSGRGLCVESSVSWAEGEEKRDKMTTLCLSSKSSGGVKVFQIKLEILP